MLTLVQSISAHKGKAWAVDWCPAGEDKLVSGGEDKVACVWSAEELKKDKIPETPCSLLTKMGSDNHTRSVRDVAWSPCGRYVLLASFDGQVTLWEKQGRTYSCVSVIEGHENEVKAVSWSPSGRYFASCGRDKNVMIWSVVDDGEDVECAGVMTVHTQDVKRVVWHPHEDILASCSYDDTIKLYHSDADESDWSTTTTITGHSSTVWAIDFDSSGNRLISCSDDRTMKVWEKGAVEGGDSVNDWKCLTTVTEEHNRPIYDVAWNKVTGLVATACGDDYIRIFQETSATDGVDATCFKLLHKIKAHNSDVNCVKWNPRQPDILASAGDDGCVKVWKWHDALD